MELITRYDIMTAFKCSYSKANRIFNRIKKQIPEVDRKPEHKSHLPKPLLENYLSPKP